MVADSDHDGRVSRDEWGAFCVGITDIVRQTAAAGGEYPLNPWIRALYGLVDADGDGRITQQEYADWLSVLGLAESTDIPAAFAGFDTDENGSLSWEEFAKGQRAVLVRLRGPVPPRVLLDRTLSRRRPGAAGQAAAVGQGRRDYGHAQDALADAFGHA